MTGDPSPGGRVTLNRGDVIRLLDEHGLRPSRALGQNFVADANTVRRIVRLAGITRDSQVVEIGAGLGSLTLALAETGARVVAIEFDRRLVPVLRTVVAGWPVEVVEADALRLDWDRLLGSPRPGRRRRGGPSAPGSWSLVANLPYNVATPLVLGVLQRAPAVSTMMVMVQREVGERLTARPCSAAYGAVSVKVAYRATASIVGRVPAAVFVPRPRVESVLVRLVRRDVPAVSPDVVDEARLFDVVEAGFAHRRQMLRRTLAGVVDPEAFGAAGIDPRARAEELSVEEWGRLAGWRSGG